MLRPTKGMMTGGVKGGPTKQAPIVRPTEIERAPPKPLPETKETAPAPETPAEMTFTFVEGKERGDASPYTLYKQTGEVRQVTVDDLRAFYNDPKQTNRIPEVFGTFDNYLAYMTEREELLQSGELTLGDWAEATGGLTFEQEMILKGEDLRVDLNDPLQNPAELARRVTSAQQAGYQNWINSEVNKNLLEKYGVKSTVYSDSGDKFEWNGSAYVKTVNEDHAGVGDFVKIGLAIAAGVATGGAASGALSSALGATGSAAVGAGLGSVVSQGLATGEIDIEKALIAAATAGITNEFSEFLGTYVEGSTQEQIKRLRDIQATVQPGGNAYQAAQQQIDLLTGALESADLVNQGGSIVNLVGDATEAYNQYRDIQENIDNFTEENEDAAWQTPDTTDILGDVQVQIRDYVSELEEQREESRESGEAGAQPVQPVEDIFADTTAEETGLEPETTITEEMFSEYFPQPIEGPQGDPGRDGIDGIDGIDGADGRDGIDGVDGRDGRDGRDGVDGRDADPEVVRGIVESVVNNAISNIPPGTSTEEVKEIVNAAIIGLDIPEGMTADQVREIVGTAIGNIQFPDSVTQEQVNQVVSGVRSDLETATTELGASIADVRGEVRDVESSLRDALEAQSEGQTRELTEAEARLLSEITGVEAGLLQQLSTVQGGLNSRLQNLGTDLDSVRDELGTSILGVQREVSEVERSLTEALEAATLGQATDLSDAEARLLSELTGVEEDILQQMAESDAGLEAGLFDLGTNINQVRADLQSQIQTTQQETAQSLEQATEERRQLQEALAAQASGQARQLTEAEARLLSEITGVEAGVLQQLSTVEGALNTRLNNIGTDISQVQVDLESSIAGVRGEVRDVETSLQNALAAQAQGQARQLTDAEARLLSQITGVEANTLRQLSTVEGALNNQLNQLGTNIGDVQTQLEFSIAGVRGEVKDVERSLQDALSAQSAGQARALTEAEARLLSQITGVNAQTLQQLSTVEGALNTQLNQLGTNINSVQNQLEQSIAGIAAGQQTAEQERRDLQQALIAVGGDVNRLDAQTRQQFEAFGEDVNQLFAGVNVDIEGLQAGQVSQAEAFAQYQADAATQATQATEERRNLQQAIIGAQGNIEALDANTRQQFEEFGENVNELFSDVDVDIEALQEGQISQAEAQAAFEQSVSEQFGQVGEGLAGLGEGLEGLGQGVAGLGAGLGMGLLSLGQQQEQLAAELAKPDPIPFDPFLKGLSPFQILTPTALSSVQQKDAVSELDKYIRQTGMLV